MIITKLAHLGIKVTRLVTDSRLVQTGDTFLAYQGEHNDGRNYISQAIAHGANAVIWDARGFNWQAEWQVPNLAVHDLPHHLGELADEVYGEPSKQLWMVGVTGTNGKTSTSHWVAQAFTDHARKCALIGTLGNGFLDSLRASANTTPDAIQVHRLLADFLQQQARAVAMEVSSHGLTQGRVHGVRFDVALLTNLSRDHLDYHGDMQHYAASKAKLFHDADLKFAVLNLDDPFGAMLAEQLQDQSVEVIGYGLSDAARKFAKQSGLRLVQGHVLSMNAQGFHLDIQSSWGRATLHSHLIGRFNAENILGVLAVLLVSDLALQDAVRSLETVEAVSGRMQQLGKLGQPAVIVDYAHTPDALEKVLMTLRETMVVSGGKLVCVFGCGGDRDRGKRKMMGRIAELGADQVILTNDNPRNEVSTEIIAEIVEGMHENHYCIVEDRTLAIQQAIRAAAINDTVLIAGKGHETYQEVQGVKYPYSDISVALAALQTREAVS
ncbi:MAG: UDP-N-acetylmuramoyl-L-alanyl-D-glutamate--2,6-diaminopimelate ligase [Gallionella sp.]|nr:UDP-N-acetylmuramoyl-L-alanyl-D-glutamate--2,6-diaminopimelate ligase [Gallionella sp.]